MAEVYCIVNKTIKLADRTQKINLNEPLAYDNANAHAMRVTVFNDDGEPESLSGIECKGSFTPSGGNTLTPIPGEITGVGLNVAQVILPAACYVHPGRFKFTMNLTKQDGTSRTVLWVEGHVERNRTQTIEVPTEILDVDQVIMEASAAARDAREAAENAEGFTDSIAPTFEDLMATSPFVPLEAFVQHCWKDGTLYVNNVDINAAEAWDATHWNAVDVSGELSWCLKRDSDVATEEEAKSYLGIT